jgi:hypothetical protein
LIRVLQEIGSNPFAVKETSFRFVSTVTRSSTTNKCKGGTRDNDRRSARIWGSVKGRITYNLGKKGSGRLDYYITSKENLRYNWMRSLNATPRLRPCYGGSLSPVLRWLAWNLPERRERLSAGTWYSNQLCGPVRLQCYLTRPGCYSSVPLVA